MRLFGLELEFAARGRPSTKPPTQVSRASWKKANYITSAGVMPKPTPVNLRRFSETPPMRRAINAIKNPVLNKPWEVRPRKGVPVTDDVMRRIRIAEAIFEEPNMDDSFYSFTGAVLEDMLVGGGGPIEVRTNGNMDHPLWMWSVDFSTIAINPDWNGSGAGARYAQTLIGIPKPIPLPDDILVYLKPNPRTFTPWGLGPGEVAFNYVNHFLTSHTAAHKRAANERPEYIITLGQNAKANEVLEFRSYWMDEIEGTGQPPIIGGTENPNILRLTQGTDSDLRIKWQEFQMHLISIAFDLSPGKLGLNKDINRSTKEGQMEEDDDGAIEPWAKLIAVEFTRHFLWKRLGWRDLEFTYCDVDVKDELTRAQIHQIYYNINALTPDEIREQLGRGPLDNERGTVLRSQGGSATPVPEVGGSVNTQVPDPTPSL
jgi:hypothetical protein